MARVESDPAKRKAIYQKLNEMMVDEALPDSGRDGSLGSGR